MWLSFFLCPFSLLVQLPCLRSLDDTLVVRQEPLAFAGKKRPSKLHLVWSYRGSGAGPEQSPTRTGPGGSSGRPAPRAVGEWWTRRGSVGRCGGLWRDGERIEKNKTRPDS